MKQKLIIMFVLVFSWSFAMTQGTPMTVLPLLGEIAPSFTASSTNGTIHFPKDYGDGWKIIMCHPADFTPVCSSELLDLAALQDDFTKLHVSIVVVSTDNLDKHNQWVKSMESIEYKNRPTSKIEFPLVADEDHSIAKKYGMIHPGTNTTKDVRGVFIIDPQNKIRAMFYYPMSIGRNMDEIKRTVLALETADNNEVLTPSGWQQGDDVLIPYTKYTSDQLELAKTEDPSIYMVSWYMWFKKMQ